MKKPWIQVILIAVALLCIFTLAGCDGPSQPVMAESGTPQAESLPTVTVTPTVTETPQPTAVSLPESLTIISDGNVCGGYVDGKWLTQTEAASYLDGPVTFHTYNLLGEGEAVESKGVSYTEDEYVYGATKDYPGSGSGLYTLELDGWGSDPQSYSEDPLEYYYLYHVGADSVPDITVVEDTAEVKTIIQDMLNDQFGKDAPEAEIIIAVSADIDADGEQETVVNAANDEQNVYEYYADKPLYCISCVIESNGEVVVIDEFYLDAEEAVNEYNDQLSEEDYESDDEVVYEEGDDIAFYTYIPFFYVQNIIDLDHDGVCELVMFSEAWEASDVTVLTYDGKTVNEVLIYGWGV